MPALSNAQTSNSSSASSGALVTQHERRASNSVVHARRCASIFTALIVRVIVRKLRKVVELEVHVDALICRLRHAGLGHDDKFVLPRTTR
eukprot:857444-Prymnesium_polylepis.1